MPISAITLGPSQVTRIMSKKKKALTLIEVLVGLALLVLLLSLAAFPMRRFLKEREFETSIKRLKERIELAQELSLLGKSNIYLIISEKQCSISSEKDLRHFPQKWLNRGGALSGIARIQFTTNTGEALNPIK